MKNNRFYQNKKAIQRISREKNVDVSVAARMLVKEKGWEDYHAELNAWEKLCIQYMRHPTKTLADLFEE